MRKPLQGEASRMIKCTEIRYVRILSIKLNWWYYVWNKEKGLNLHKLYKKAECFNYLRLKNTKFLV